MNSGTDFEALVFRLVTEILDAENPDCGWRVYHRRRYYSRDRDRAIEVDVAAEYSLRGAQVPSVIWIWECKDYALPVPVSDVEEFHSKLAQIGDDNTKGTLATRGPMQRSALAYSRSKRIGIVRVFGNQHHEWLSHFGERRIDYVRALCDIHFAPTNGSVIALTSAGDVTTSDLATYVHAETAERAPGDARSDGGGRDE